MVPAHNFVKSVYNITVERGWRPLYHRELANLLEIYHAKTPMIFLQGNATHV